MIPGRPDDHLDPGAGKGAPEEQAGPKTMIWIRDHYDGIKFSLLGNRQDRLGFIPGAGGSAFRDQDGFAGNTHLSGQDDFIHQI